MPGERLEFQYQVDAIEPEYILAIEASVMWYSEGKGDEELSVHFFDRHVPTDEEDGDLRRMRKLATILPNTPHSYDGIIVKLRWCIRVKLFWGKNRETQVEHPLILGNTPIARSAAS